MYDDCGAVIGKRLSDAQKIHLVDNHFHPASDYKFPTTFMAGCNRRFKWLWLTKNNWLRYSKQSDGGFCLPCVLFSKSLNVQILVKQPFRDFGKCGAVFERHNKDPSHLEAYERYKNFVATTKDPSLKIDQALSDRAKQLHKDNLHILKVIVSKLHFLAKQGLPLRGHRDDAGSEATNRGNFIELLWNTSTSDPVLLNHLETCQKNARYTSKTIQGELLSIMGQTIVESVVGEVKEAGIFSILADEVTDCSNKEQLCICIRFVDSKKDVREEFVDFVHCQRITGEVLVENILQTLENNGLDIQNVRGQGYDGAANMSSLRKGVAGRVLALNDLALYSHCSSHKLNLAVVHSCAIPEIRNSSEVMGKLARFFSYSPKREHFLLQLIEKECPERKKKKLKDVCRTRWVERHEAYSTMLELYVLLVKALDNMVTSEDFDVDSRAQALSFLKSLKSSDYIVSCLVINKALAVLQPVSVKLQGVAVDVIVANDMVGSVIDELKLFDDATFSEIYQQARSLASQVGEDISAPRVVGIQRHRANPPASTALEHFRIAIYKPFMSHLISELETRFTESRSVINQLCKLVPPCSITPQDVRELSDFYYGDLHSPGYLESEVKRWRDMWAGRKETPQNTSESLKLCDKDIYPNIHQLLKTLLTIPVTTAEVERGNSKLKLLKTRLRSVMSEERLSYLAMLFIHNDYALDYKQIVERFANNRPRRMTIQMSQWE